MTAALVLVAAGLVAFLVRGSMVHAVHGRRLPGWLDRAFTAAIPAGLAATIVVAVAARGQVSPARVVALALATVVASRTGSMLGVVGAGLASLWALQLVGAG
jgi:branched-subunit amino acid transport protein